MAGLIGHVKTIRLALAASTLKTVVQITAPTNQRLKILGWGVFFDEEVGDATPALPLYITVGRQVGGTGTANTPVRHGPQAETLQATAKDNFSVAATTTILDAKMVNAQTGYEIYYAPGQEIIVGGAELFGIDVTPGSVISTGGLNVVAHILYEE
jgi:hypothetical protein